MLQAETPPKIVPTKKARSEAVLELMSRDRVKDNLELVQEKYRLCADNKELREEIARLKQYRRPPEKNAENFMAQKIMSEAERMRLQAERIRLQKKVLSLQADKKKVVAENDFYRRKYGEAKANLDSIVNNKIRKIAIQIDGTRKTSIELTGHDGVTTVDVPNDGGDSVTSRKPLSVD